MWQGSNNKKENIMSEEWGYGDCRDSCINYAIEGVYACYECAAEMDRAQEQEENECYFGRGSQG